MEEAGEEAEEAGEEAEEAGEAGEGDQLNPQPPNQQPPTKETESWKERNLPFLLAIEQGQTSSCTNLNSISSSTPLHQS